MVRSIAASLLYSKFFALFVVLVANHAFTLSGSAQESRFPIFVPAPTGEQPVAAIENHPRSPVETLRSRAAGIERQVLESALIASGNNETGSAQTAGTDRALLLNLFSDTSLEFFPEKVYRSDDGIGWIAEGSIGAPRLGRGRASGQPAGTALLSYYQGALSGSVHLHGGEFYEISISESNRGEIRQLRFRGFPADASDFTAIQDSVPYRDREKSGGSSSSILGILPLGAHSAGTASTIEVLIAYTGRAASQHGSEAGMQSNINWVLAATNSALANSGVPITLRLVRAVEVQWDDSRSDMDYGVALEAIQATSDGKLDHLHSLRDQYGADLVSLWVNPPLPNGTFVVGQAFLLNASPQSFADHAFSVVHDQFAGSPAYTFAHEIGHNLGLIHDVDNSFGARGLFDDSKGYQQEVFSPKFYTIMAYANGCDGCERIAHYSNDSINYQNIGTGVTNEADAARTLEYVAPFAQAWRAHVNQPCSYEISPSALSSPPDGSTLTVQVTTQSGCPWTAVPDVPWLTVPQGSGGSGSGSFSLTIATNTTYSYRAGSVAVANKTLTISQAGNHCSIDVSPTSFSFESGPASGFVDISSSVDCPWSASAGSEWVTITSSASGIRSGRVTFSVPSNPSLYERRGFLHIHPNRSVTIDQAALVPECSYSLNGSSTKLSYVQQELRVPVSTYSHCEWSAQSNTPWITLTSGATGKGDGSPTFQVQANPGPTSRAGTVTVAGITYSVEQQPPPPPCTFTIDPPAINVLSAFSTVILQVTTQPHCWVSANSNTAWIQVFPLGPETTGSRQVEVRVFTNQTQSPRTSTINVAGVSVTVEQAGTPPCDMSVDKTAFTIRPEGASFQVNLSGPQDCAWSAASEASWISNGTTFAGTGPASLQFVVSRNPLETSRTGTVRVAGHTVTVEQSGQPVVPSLTASPALLRFTARLGESKKPSAVVSLETGSAISIVSVTPGFPSWILLSVTSLQTPGSLQVTVNPEGLEPGAYTHQLRLSTPHSSAEISVSLTVLETAPLQLSARALSFRTKQGTNPPAQTLLARTPGSSAQVQAAALGFPWLQPKVTLEEDTWQVEVAANASSLIPGTYDGVVTISCPNDTCSKREIPVRLTVAATSQAASGDLEKPEIGSGGLVNAASFQPGISSGAWISVFGVNLSATARTWELDDFVGDRMPTAIDGISVKVAGKPAAIHFVSGGQVNFQAPDELTEGWVPVELTTPRGSDFVWAFATNESPGFFQFDAAGNVAALHPDGTPVGSDSGAGYIGRPAKVGSVLAIYGTGFGPTKPDVPSGYVFSSAAPLASADTVSVTIGGMEAEVQYAGLTGAGLNQVNVKVPSLPPGVHEIVATVADSPTQFHGKLLVEQ